MTRAVMHLLRSALIPPPSPMSLPLSPCAVFLRQRARRSSKLARWIQRIGLRRCDDHRAQTRLSLNTCLKVKSDCGFVCRCNKLCARSDTLNMNCSEDTGDVSGGDRFAESLLKCARVLNVV